ncbi:MAG: RDD family protein [Candidatus Nanopelagicales bacterium]
MSDQVDPHEADADGRGVRARARRAVGATVGRVTETVGDVALEVTGSTTAQVIEDLEPYLVAEAIPRILEGLTPVLVEDLLPRILADLRPHLEADLVPGVVDALVPHLSEQVAPELLDALMPKIRDEIAPDLVRALMPMIEAEVAPQLVDALLPKIRDEMAPELVDALLPKIRAEVVPLILEDIVDDPRVRDLIREQSQGLFLDALESMRENMADVDNLVENVGRRLVRRAARPESESGLALVLEASGRGDRSATRATLDSLADQRRAWRAMPVPPAPPGREFAHAGVVTRALAFSFDVALIGWLVSQGLSALVNLLDSVIAPIPTWLVVTLGLLAASFVPIYMGLSWWLTGRTLGDWLVGTRVCTPDGRNPHFVRALVRGWLASVGAIVWVATGVLSFFDPRRRTLLDRLLHTEVRTVVPEDQQRRYVREAVQAHSGVPAGR